MEMEINHKTNEGNLMTVPVEEKVSEQEYSADNIKVLEGLKL